MSDLRQLLADSKGLPAAFRKDHAVNTIWGGLVTKVAVQQVRDDDGNPENWDDGNPKQQVVIAIQTTQRDPERTNDDGVRGIYVKWWGEQRKALMKCLETAGVEDIEPGGMFAAQYIGDGPQPQNKMYSPAKLMRYEYRPPSPTAGLFSQNGNGAAPPPPPPPPPPPQQQAAPPPPPQPTANPWGAIPGADPWGAAPLNDPWAAAATQPAAVLAAAAAPPAATTPPPPPPPPPAAVGSMFGTPPPGLGSILGPPPPAAAPPAAAPPAAASPAAAPPAAAPPAAAPPPPPPPPPATAAPAAPTDPAALVATIKMYIGLGMTDAQIAETLGVAAAGVGAVRNLPA